MIECVPNFSEGRNQSVIDKIETSIRSVPGVHLLHRTSDIDHNRSVFTFAGQRGPVLEAALRAAEAAVLSIDLNTHRGVHPRVGALDVLPFVPLYETTMDECVDLARQAGERLWTELRVPVYYYEAAALRPDRARLETVRRGQFEALRELAPADPGRQPDVGGPELHPTAGAAIVGARKVLLAFNINLRSSNLEIAQQIAKRIRASSGGMPAVKALGLPLESKRLVQVSMNLTDLDRTPVHAVYAAVSELAREHGIEIENSELIGLIPRRALEAAAAEYLKLIEFTSQRVIENRIETLSKDDIAS